VLENNETSEKRLEKGVLATEDSKGKFTCELLEFDEATYKRLGRSCNN